MADWREYARLGQKQAAQVPMLIWAVAGVIAASLIFVVWLETSAPPYTALYEGLSPADGGKVIAQLQKLGIPYQLQAAGDIIMVPVPELAEARLQLGAAQIPQTDVSSGWDKLEDAPMTASDLAQSTMASQALESSLQQSIETLDGIHSAQVYIALPPDTPFLADQPKPTASVVIAADQQDAEAQGVTIANLVAGAVPGLAVAQVSVATTSGVTVYPADDLMTTTSQFATVAEVENGAMGRIAALLGPLVGPDNFRTDVSANLDFTKEHIRQIAYGPTQLMSHDVTSQSDRVGGDSAAAIGIPGALSNEPPAPTVATTPPPPVPNSPPKGGGTAANAPTQTAAAPTPAVPGETASSADQTYVTDESDADIVKPDWTVKSLAISVVLNKKALGTVTTDQVKAALAGAFAYQQVSVTVLSASFQPPGAPHSSAVLMQATGPLTHAILEVLAAAALLFGVALPLAKRLSSPPVSSPAAQLPEPRRAIVASLSTTDYSDLRKQATEHIGSVAKLLQNWTEESE
jgi:flagellar M-ring protein FliF